MLELPPGRVLAVVEPPQSQRLDLLVLLAAATWQRAGGLLRGAGWDAEGRGGDMTDPEAFELITAAIAEAKKQCEYAYRFCPGSYTHSALVAVQTAEKNLSKPKERT